MAGTRSAAGVADNSITALLTQLSEGNREIEARLIPLLYKELRRLAAHYMRMERVNHTLQPTALVNEAYIRLVKQQPVTWQSRAHFFAVASQLMRHILVDHARARRTDKRGGVQHQVNLDENVLAAKEHSIDVLALHEALERLTKFDPRQGRIIELHFFGGLSFDEIALVLHISERTAKRDWSMAKTWLKRELSERA
jgi:RNA polymerase sigma factor (TIGR02999 family)